MAERIGRHNWAAAARQPDPMDRLDGVVDELALIPSARFFRLSHAPKRAVVVGPRIALIHLVRWPPGRYTWRGFDTDVRRDGEPFYPAAKQFDAALNSIESRVAPADLRLFVVVETEDAEKIELTVPAGGRITFVRQETLVEQVREFLLLDNLRHGQSNYIRRHGRSDRDARLLNDRPCSAAVDGAYAPQVV